MAVTKAWAAAGGSWALEAVTVTEMLAGAAELPKLSDALRSIVLLASTGPFLRSKSIGSAGRFREFHH